jgi:hypothetical protein
LTPAIVGMMCLLCGSAFAAEPRIGQLVPQGVRRGAETKVTLLGARIAAEPQELMLDQPGVTVTKLERVADNTVEATLNVAADAPLGRHAIRLRTTTGVSNLVTLHVGALESVNEVEPNSAIAQAQAIPLGRTVHGVVKVEDDDYFAVDLTEGQRISVDVEGIRLGRTFFDPCIELLDAAGETVAASDDEPAAMSCGYESLPTRATTLRRICCTSATSRGQQRRIRPWSSLANRARSRSLATPKVKPSSPSPRQWRPRASTITVLPTARASLLRGCRSRSSPRRRRSKSNPTTVRKNQLA